MQALTTAIHIMHADPIMTVGMHTILSEQPGLRVTSHLRQPEAQRVARVLVADYDTGVALARQGGGGSQAPAVLVVSQFDKEWEVRIAMDAGVAGYLPQSCAPDELAHAAGLLVRGQRYLSESMTRSVAESLTREALTGRETDVLQLLAQGCCNKSIARKLGIGVGTVKTHVKGVMSKLDATARTHAVVVATQRGLIRPGAGSASAPIQL